MMVKISKTICLRLTKSVISFRGKIKGREAPDGGDRTERDHNERKKDFRFHRQKVTSETLTYTYERVKRKRKYDVYNLGQKLKNN